MTDKKTLFTVGDITYDKEWYQQNGLPVKPVRYTESFLKQIASNTQGSSLELSHGNVKSDVVGYVNDYDFVDNHFRGTVTTIENTEGLGYSPEFEANFIDKGDCYEAIDGKLLKIVLTDTPRCYTTCNSVEGGSNMEDTIANLNKQIKDLTRDNVRLENQVKLNEEKIKEYDSLQEKVKELESQNNDYKNQIDGLKPKAESYEKIEAGMKEELLTKAFGEDEEAKTAWRTASMEQLESLAKHREVTRNATGIGAGNAEGFNEGNEGNEDEPDEAEKALAFFKKLHGEEPEFLKQQGGE